MNPLIAASVQNIFFEQVKMKLYY